MPNVSVIIPTYNRLPRLKRVLEALTCQTFSLQDIEVVVVSDGSSDGTWGYLQQVKLPYSLIPLQQANAGPAQARNFGLSKCSGEYVLFLDDDVLPSAQLISEHQNLHAQNGSASISLGPMLTPPSARYSTWVDWEQAMLYRQYEAMLAGEWEPTPRQFYTGNTSVARELLEKAGKFDPRFRRAEDVELAMRLEQEGARFYFNPSAYGYHFAERGFDSWFAIPYEYGKNDVIFINHKGHDWLQDVIRKEYHQRNPFTQTLTKVCMDRPTASKACLQTLRILSATSYFAGLKKLSRQLCSAIFNARYYQGVSDQLGGRDKFHELVFA